MLNALARYEFTSVDVSDEWVLSVYWTIECCESDTECLLRVVPWSALSCDVPPPWRGEVWEGVRDTSYNCSCSKLPARISDIFVTLFSRDDSCGAARKAWLHNSPFLLLPGCSSSDTCLIKQHRIVFASFIKESQLLVWRIRTTLVMNISAEFFVQQKQKCFLIDF